MLPNLPHRHRGPARVCSRRAELAQGPNAHSSRGEPASSRLTKPTAPPGSGWLRLPGDGFLQPPREGGGHLGLAGVVPDEVLGLRELEGCLLLARLRFLVRLALLRRLLGLLLSQLRTMGF